MQKNKRVFKCAAVFFAAAVLSAFCLTVSAAENPLQIRGSFSGNVAEVTFRAESKGYGSFVYVFGEKLDKNAPDIQGAAERGSLVYAGISSDGTLTFTLPEDAPYGVYTVMVGASGLPAQSEYRTEYIIRADDAAFASAAAVIEASATPDELYQNLERYNNELYIVDLDAVSGKRDIMFGIMSTFGFESAETLVENTLDVASAAEGDPAKTAEILTERPQLLGLEGNEDLSDNLPAAADIFVSLCSGNADINSYDSLRAAALEAVAVASFNDAGYSTVLNVIKKYNYVFNVNFESENYKTADLYEVQKLVSAAECMNKEQVKAAFDSAVSTAPRSSDGGGGNKTSRGGGGGGGGGAVSAGIMAAADIDEYAGRGNVFNDLDGFGWAQDAIERLASRNVLSGDGSGSFRPSDSITREEFVKIVVEAFEIDKSKAKQHFDDVPEDAWYCGYIISALNKNIISGIGDNMFGTGKSITRQDAAVIISRVVDSLNITLDREKTLVDFTDYGEVSEYAAASVDFLARSGILNGFDDGTFRPFERLTRAEASKIIYECIKNR